MKPASAVLKECGVNSIFLRTDEDKVDENFYYVTGISKSEQLSSALILRRGAKPQVLASPLEFGDLKKYINLDVKKADSGETAAALKALKGAVGINGSSMTVNAYARMKKYIKSTKDISEAMGNLRETKTQEEIRRLKEAARVADECIGFVAEFAKRSMTEASIANMLEYAAKRIGAEASAFPTIVASGRAACVPHHKTSRSRIGRGLLLVDFGVVYDGYCSDLTRMFCVGAPTERMKSVFGALKQVQTDAISAAKHGARADKIFNAADTSMKQKLGQNLVHSLGHGIGVSVHDFPRSISSKSDFFLKEDMVFTIEPGYYGDVGVRVEDEIIVKKNGVQLLSKPQKQLIEI